MTHRGLLGKPVVLALLAGGLLLAGERVLSLASDGAQADPSQDSAQRPERARRDPASAASAAPAATALRLERLALREREPGQVPRADLFATPPVLAAARPVAASAPPAAPVAPRPPPFPYTYIGTLVDEGTRLGFFSRGEQVLKLRVGDVVDSNYRVDQLVAGRMTLTYLPLGEQLIVSYGASQ